MLAGTYLASGPPAGVPVQVVPLGPAKLTGVTLAVPSVTGMPDPKAGIQLLIGSK